MGSFVIGKSSPPAGPGAGSFASGATAPARPKMGSFVIGKSSPPPAGMGVGSFPPGATGPSRPKMGSFVIGKSSAPPAGIGVGSCAPGATAPADTGSSLTGDPAAGLGAVAGAGAPSGLRKRFTKGSWSNYGAIYKSGLTRLTEVEVPTSLTRCHSKRSRLRDARDWLLTGSRRPDERAETHRPGQGRSARDLVHHRVESGRAHRRSLYRENPR